MVISATRYVPYYRLSTTQQAALFNFLKGGRPQGEYVEVESGKKN